LAAVLWAAVAIGLSTAIGDDARAAGQKGICAVLGLAEDGNAKYVTDLAARTDYVIFFQSPDAKQVAAVREAAAAAGLLGDRVFAARGELDAIQLADNLAGEVITPDMRRIVDKAEVLRVLHPGGTAMLGERGILKPVPDGVDDWGHPYHGPDNNPQSTDQLARAPYLTQFLGDPKFCPMPEVSVAAGGRVFRAFGHIAHKANQNPMLNKLLCINAYNGTVLWQRDLKEGFMIHRNTMIATGETLYLADDESCKLIDAATGNVADEIVAPADLSDGKVWKWMSLVDGVLYALVGGPETSVRTQPSGIPGMGHWPWGMWEGHDYANPRNSFGFGRTLVAIDPDSKKVLWSHRDDEYLDSRGVCMGGGKIYVYCPEKFVRCIDAKNGKVLWTNDDADLLEAIGPNGRAQHYVTGYATTSYIKCNEEYLFFAGPQRSRLVVASAEDGKLLWHRPHGNFQIVLRDDGFYAAGPQETGAKLSYETGEILARLSRRRACTRATGSVDSIFYRTPGGTVRIDTETNAAEHIAPMRPPCQDGVIISDGLLYWGPWMCGCQLSFYGHICLGPAGDFDFSPAADDSRLELACDDPASVEEFAIGENDWPVYRGNNARSSVTRIKLPQQVARQWAFEPGAAMMPTAPVIAGDLVFVADRAGIVRAIDAEGKLRWKTFVGSAVYYPPVVAENRVFVGSADGRVYALEAATGRNLWSFRVAPADRIIPVYGKLISTWPVAGGVVVQDGTVYAAAGMAHYDGTHVVALDAVTGKLKWYNSSSGALSEKVNSGVSLQGPLMIAGGELRFLGGGVYQMARYDLKTGKCLNEPFEGVNSRFATAFYPFYPTYGQYQSLAHPYPDGTLLMYNAAYDGSRHTNLGLLAAQQPGATDRPAPRVSDRPAPRGPQRRALWQAPAGRRYNSLIVGPNAVLAAGQAAQGDAVGAFLAAVDVDSGKDLWYRRLPAAAVKGGTAVDGDGRIVVALQDGRIVCMAAE